MLWHVRGSLWCVIDNIIREDHLYMVSVRCHAAIVEGNIVRNVLVRYSPDVVPGTCRLTIQAIELSVSPMGHEEHSTVAFNGVAVISGHDICFVPISEYVEY